MKDGVKAEYHRARKILMHSPSDELFCGNLNYEAAAFEKPFNTQKAIEEHENYVKTLENSNIKVFKVKDVLLDGVRPGNKEHKQLVDLVLSTGSFNYDTSKLNPDQRDLANKVYHRTLENMTGDDLFTCLMTKPNVKLKPNQTSDTAFIANYEFSPIMNLMFTRDQQITTDKGIIMGKMKLEHRTPETKITKYVWNKLRVPVIYEISGNGTLEGGDFIPMDSYALIGQGLRTNSEGIEQLLNNGRDALGYEQIVVVKDEFQNQDQMHLDTYFNVFSKRKAAMVEGRIKKEKGLKLYCDIYNKKDNGEFDSSKPDVTNADFVDYLRLEKGMTLVPITNEEQLNYGLNFLTIGHNEIIGVRNPNQSYLEKVRDQYKVCTKFLNLDSMISAYGGPHCTTQVFHREPSIYGCHTEIDD